MSPDDQESRPGRARLVADISREGHRRFLEVLAPHLKDVLDIGDAAFVLGKPDYDAILEYAVCALGVEAIGCLRLSYGSLDLLHSAPILASIDTI